MEQEATIDPGSGLTADERRVVSCAVSAWNGFVNLPGFTVDDKDDFRKAIHDIERIIAQHALARLYPEFWV